MSELGYTVTVLEGDIHRKGELSWAVMPVSEKGRPAFGRTPLLWERLQVLLVGLDHLLDHLAADRAGLAAGQVAVIAVLQVDAHLLRCVFTSKI